MMSVDDFEYKISNEYKYKMVKDVKISEGIYKNNRMKTYEFYSTLGRLYIEIVFNKGNKIIMASYFFPQAMFLPYKTAAEKYKNRLLSATFFLYLYQAAFNVDEKTVFKKISPNSDVYFIIDKYTIVANNQFKKNRAKYKEYVFYVERMAKFIKFSVLPEEVDKLLHKEKIKS